MIIMQSEKLISPIKTSPHSSNVEMTINTPENRTYTQPMLGFYPATYGFENTINGADPEGWKVTEESGTTFQIISGLDGHYKIAEFYDIDNYNIAYMRRNLTIPRIKGTVEWWMRISKLRQSYVAFRENDVSGTYATYVSFNFNGDLQYYTGSNQYMQDYSPNTWYHIKLEFDCVVDRINVWVNGILKCSNGNFWNPVSNIGGIEFYSGGAGGIDYHFYVDAIGFSWDPDYNIGDNLNEGLLLSYESSVSLEWKGYSLDGQENRTIPGNTTIPMPNDGLHSIQVFGNGSLGELYESDIRYFTIDSVSSNPPFDLVPIIIIILIGVAVTITAFILIQKMVNFKNKSETKKRELMEQEIKKNRECPYCKSRLSKDLIQKYLKGETIKCEYCGTTINNGQ